MSIKKSRALERTRSHKRRPRLASPVTLAPAGESKVLDAQFAELPTPTRILPEVHAECDNLDFIVNGILADVKALSDRLHPVLIPRPALQTTKLEEAQALSPIGARVQDTARRAGAAAASVRAMLESLAV